ncbi:MAG TPA: zinc ribbon domain-containing protein [Gemmataceae bacterium]|nr:zinc ribbon domain-containing protein [Gemmataceae bacterium]
MLRENKRRTTPHRGGAPFLLSGLLVCGHCGEPMVGWTRNPEPLYICGSYHDSGGRTCRRNPVREGPMVRELLRRLKQVYLTPEGLAKVREEVARQEKENQGEKAQQAMRAVIADLEAKVARATTTCSCCRPIGSQAQRRPCGGGKKNSARRNGNSTSWSGRGRGRRWRP